MKISISENLKRLRKQKDLTQDELATFLGVSYQAISKWERGEGYPDITLLPAIANYFKVTLDELLGMDDIRSQTRIAEIHMLWKENNALGNNQENIALMRDALKTYPNEWLFTVQLITSLEKCGDSEEAKAANRAQAIALTERLLEYCPDTEIKNAFLYNICDSYWKNGETAKAIACAKRLPSVYKTRENALVMFLEGEEKVKIGQEGIVALIVSMELQMKGLTQTDCYTPEEKLLLLQKFCNIADILYENSDVPTVCYHKALALMRMAEIALEQEDINKSLDLFIKSISEATRNGACKSLLSNSITPEAVTPYLLKRLNFQRLIIQDRYAPLRGCEGFKKIREFCGNLL